MLSDDAEELHHSAADVAVLADPAFVCAEVARRLRARPTEAVRRATVDLPDGPLTAAHVFRALAERLPRDAVVVEETPSTRPDLHRLLPARTSGGFISAAMGGLGFALPAAAGLRMGDPTRPVVAVLGDGSSLYAIQGLWSAARYECGALFIVLSNGRYAVMDQLAAEYGGKPPWPGFAEIDITALATSLGCPAKRIATLDALLADLDEVVPGLATRTDPLLLEVKVTS